MPPLSEVEDLRLQLKRSEWQRRLLERRVRRAVGRTRHPAYRGRPEALVEAVVEILTGPEAT